MSLLQSFSAVSLLAILPAAANPSLMIRTRTLAASLCAGDGAASIAIPIGDPVLPGTMASACCVKGCRQRLASRDKDGSAEDGDGSDGGGADAGEGAPAFS